MGGGNFIRRQHPDFEAFGRIKVEDWAYIGSWSHIMPGVTIGEGSLVAAGSVVTKSVAPGTVVGGNPAKFICTAEDFIERNMKYSLGRRLSAKEKMIVLLNLEEDRFIKK